MRKHSIKDLVVFAGATVLTAMLAVPAQGTVIIDDDFADGDTAATGPLEADWYYGSSSSGIEIAPGALGLVSGTSGRSINGLFPVQTLDIVGEAIRVNYTFTTPDTVTPEGGKSTAFRVGLYDSLGQAGLHAGVSASSGTPNDLYGYGIAVGGPGTLGLPGMMMDHDVNTGASADLNMRDHISNTITGTGRLQATTSNYTGVGNSGTDTGYTFVPNTEYNGWVQITRISATELRYQGSLDGAAIIDRVSSTIDSDNFDMLVFHVNSKTFGSTSSQGEADNGIDFSRVTINYHVPEPASLALMGLGGLAVLRRK